MEDWGKTVGPPNWRPVNAKGKRKLPSEPPSNRARKGTRIHRLDDIPTERDEVEFIGEVRHIDPDAPRPALIGDMGLYKRTRH